MSSFAGVLVSDQWLQSQFTQVELRSLKSKFVPMKNQNGKVTVGDLPSLMMKIKAFSEMFNEEEIRGGLGELHSDMDNEIDFEGFLRTYLDLQSRANAKVGNLKNSSSFLKATITTLLHSISESEKASYVVHINSYLRDDPFLKQFLPIDPSSNALYDLAKDGVLLCKLINVAVLGTIDERAINAKPVLNPWERNENHTLCLNSAKAIGCTVVNIGTQDLVEGRPHLVLGLISQIIKIQLLADLNLRKTPQLAELVDNNDVEELMGLAPEKVLLKWMNFHLKKAGYKKTVTNFSSDLKDGEAYAYLLDVLAPEHCSPATLDANDPAERANLVLEHAEKMDCKRYLTPKDIVEGSTYFNLAFVAQIFHQRREKKLNATYIFSVARKLGCSIFLLPEDIMKVNQKMILTLTSSIMYWSLQQPVEESESSPAASSRAASPEPSIDETPSPASATISDASPSPSVNGSVSPSFATTSGASPELPIINGASSPAASASPEASPVPSVSGEEDSLLVAEVSRMTIHDTASDNTISAQVDDVASDTATSAPLPENEET